MQCLLMDLKLEYIMIQELERINYFGLSIQETNRLKVRMTSQPYKAKIPIRA